MSKCGLSSTPATRSSQRLEAAESLLVLHDMPSTHEITDTNTEGMKDETSEIQSRSTQTFIDLCDSSAQTRNITVECASQTVSPCDVTVVERLIELRQKLVKLTS